MFEVLILGAWFAVVLTFLIALYLGIKEYNRTPPPTFLELFLYMEKMRETLEEVTKEEAKEIRKELFESELRNYDRIRKQFEKYTSSNKGSVDI